MEIIKRSATLRHVFIGDGYYDLKLGIAQIKELQETRKAGILKIWRSFLNGDVALEDIIEVIRCGLIGGGLHPEKAFHLTNIYVVSGYITEFYVIANDLINLVFIGVPEDSPIEGSDEEREEDSKKKTT